MNKIKPIFLKPISFDQAVVNACHFLDSIEDKQGSWFGKKIYLGYHNETGWKIYNLSFISQIFRKMNLAYQDTHKKLVLNKLNDLTSKEATVILSNGLAKKIPGLQEKLSEVYRQKVLGDEEPTGLSARRRKMVEMSDQINPPQQIKNTDPEKQPLSSHHQKDDSPPPKQNKCETFSEKKVDLETGKLQTEDEKVEREVIHYAPPLAASPLYLKNYNNRCYIDSVLEMMLSQDSIRKKIFELCLHKDFSGEKKSLEKELLMKLRDLILIVDKTKGGGMGDQSPIGSHSPAEKVREAIFASGLNQDLNNTNKIYIQQDASSVLLLINDLLNNSFQSVEVDTALLDPKVNQKVTALRPKSINHKLELRFEKEIKIEKSEQIDSKKVFKIDLKGLLDQLFSPKTAMVSSGKEEKRKFKLDESKGEEISLPYTTQTKLLTLPEVLTLHVGRYHFDEAKKQSSKLNHAVALPKNGIIDMAPYCSGDHLFKSCEYEITGYVVHHGNELTSGHYTANVKIGDKFYACDDTSSNAPYHKEISADEFYGNENAYLVTLKKIQVKNLPADIAAA